MRADSPIWAFYCRVTITRTPQGPFPPPDGEYWRSLEAVRAKWHFNGGVYEAVSSASTVRSLVHPPKRGGGTRIHAGITRDKQGPVGMCDAWLHGLLSLPRPGGTVQPFHEILAQPHKVREMTRQVEEGREFVVVKLTIAHYQQTIWFDPAANHLVWKFSQDWVVEGGGRTLAKRFETKVVRFKEFVPGIFYPEQVQKKDYLDGSLASTQMITFSSIRINQPLPPGAFTLMFPPGTTVSDTIQGKEYEVDAKGKPAGTLREITQMRPLPAPPVQRTETWEEPKSWTRWLLPGSVGVLVLAGCLWAVRKRSARSTENLAVKQ